MSIATEKKPRYLRLSDEMRHQVKTGVLRPGDRLPSISQLRASHGFSKSTIERAHILLEQEGLVMREHGRGTFVASPTARRMMQRTGNIGLYGLIETWAAAPNWAQILEGVREVLKERGADLMLFDPEATGIEEKVDGILINGHHGQLQPQWGEAHWPCVSLLTPTSDAGISSVVADAKDGVRQAVQHLLEMGHQRIAYLHNSHETPELKLNSYCSALQAAGIEAHAEWVRNFQGPELYFHPAGYKAMNAWLKDGWKDLDCTAILAPNDGTAVGAIQALTEAGWRVPQDISIIGLDDIGLYDYIQPRLTTVASPLREIGKLGAQILLDQIENGEHETRHITLPINLCTRNSVAPPSAKRKAQIRQTRIRQTKEKTT